VTLRGESGLVQESMVFGRRIELVFIFDIAPMKIARKRMIMIDEEDTVLGDILIIVAYLHL